MKRTYSYGGRKMKQFTCRHCGVKFTNLEDYKRHLITKHAAILIPVTQEDFISIQRFLLTSECEFPNELRELFMLGKLITSTIGQ